MKDFKRVFKYVWPQWHRLVTICCSALLIGVLYGLSFGTISPLLTVMMGSEGLHSWTNRNISSHRYGMKFYVPEQLDFSDPNKPNVAYSLQIAEVKRNSLAEQTGLQHFPGSYTLNAISQYGRSCTLVDANNQVGIKYFLQ